MCNSHGLLHLTVYNDRHGPPVPIGTRVMVRLQSTPAVAKMRWMWAIYMIMTKREHAARRAIATAKFRVERLRIRATKLVSSMKFFMPVSP